MNQITMNMNQILTLVNLYSEFLACLVAASVLSLFAGWMLNRSAAKKRLRASTRSWERKIKKLEETARTDTDNLEEQLQDLATETRTLKARNRVLTESLEKNDATIQKARAEAIELNRQNAETQERLQRVIHQKEFGSADSDDGVLSVPKPDSVDSHDMQGSTYTSLQRTGISSSALGMASDDGLDDEFESTLADNTDRVPAVDSADSDEAAMNTADTIAFNPADLFDATLQMSADDFVYQNRQLSLPADTQIDDPIDDTLDISGMYADDMEDATVALDDESLAFAKGPFSLSNVD